MRVLLDENVYPGLRKLLPGHEVDTVQHAGWKGLKNGKLLAKAIEARFDVFVTLDQSIPSQNYLSTKPIAILILRLDTRTKRSYLDFLQALIVAIDEIQAGEIVILDART